MKKLNIGIFGGSFCCPNFGVGALTISQCQILSNIAKALNITIDVICYESIIQNSYLKQFDNLTITLDTHSLNIFEMRKKFARHDIILDLYGGDSFSDIYSRKGFLIGCTQRLLSINKSNKYIMAPQTVGPFSTQITFCFAQHLMKKADKIFCRDNHSIEEISITMRNKAIPVIDMAFRLPYTQANKTKQIGINVSGLLWNTSLLGEKKEAYKKAINELIKYCIKKSISIELVPHVYDINDTPDGDYNVSKQIVGKYSSEYVKLAPRFKDPVEAKSYISKYQLFIGSRMHATIASASIGIPTIPISYSKKFRGIFQAIEYPYIIEPYEIDERVLITRVNQVLSNYEQSVNIIRKSCDKAMRLIQPYDDYLHEIIERLGVEY